MSISVDAQCYLCHLRRYIETVTPLGDADTATAFARDLMRLYLSLPEGSASPNLGPGTNALLQKYYGLDADRFREEKEASNDFVLARLPEIRETVARAEDPVYAALQCAVLGNYIDYSALQGEVSLETLDTLLRGARSLPLDRGCYDALCRDLARAKTLLYLTDNAGEIGFDRVLAEELHRRYPALSITFCVRGAPAVNDATREDAARVGIPFPVIDSGSAIAGTDLGDISDEARGAIASADVILAKGQGNTETLYGCGYNIYYAFLIKCPRFAELFHRPKFTPMLVREPAKQANGG